MTCWKGVIGRLCWLLDVIQVRKATLKRLFAAYTRKKSLYLGNIHLSGFERKIYFCMHRRFATRHGFVYAVRVPLFSGTLGDIHPNNTGILFPYVCYRINRHRNFNKFIGYSLQIERYNLYVWRQVFGDYLHYSQ